MAEKSNFTEELGRTICNQLASGDKSLRDICRELDIPPSNIVYWTYQFPAFAAQYARAREIGAEIAFAALDDLANEAPATADGKTDHGWVNWRRLQIDTLKWSLSKRVPKKYGDRQALDITVDDSLAESIAKARKRDK